MCAESCLIVPVAGLDDDVCHLLLTWIDDDVAELAERAVEAVDRLTESQFHRGYLPFASHRITGDCGCGDTITSSLRSTGAWAGSIPAARLMA
jgi:hypothetical protein